MLYYETNINIYTNTWYVFSDELKNNRFVVEIKGIATPVEIECYIPDGNYSAGDLESFLNDTYFENNSNDTLAYEQLKYIQFKINPFSLKCIFKLQKLHQQLLK